MDPDEVSLWLLMIDQLIVDKFDVIQNHQRQIYQLYGIQFDMLYFKIYLVEFKKKRFHKKVI